MERNQPIALHLCLVSATRAAASSAKTSTDTTPAPTAASTATPTPHLGPPSETSRHNHPSEIAPHVVEVRPDYQEGDNDVDIVIGCTEGTLVDGDADGNLQPHVKDPVETRDLPQGCLDTAPTFGISGNIGSCSAMINYFYTTIYVIQSFYKQNLT